MSDVNATSLWTYVHTGAFTRVAINAKAIEVAAVDADQDRRSVDVYFETYVGGVASGTCVVGFAFSADGDSVTATAEGLDRTYAATAPSCSEFLRRFITDNPSVFTRVVARTAA